MRFVRALVRRLRAQALQSGPGRASPAAERELTSRILAGLPDPAPATGPRVAVVILNRDGVRHLRRLLPALESTAYPDFEIILVDNASNDGSVAYARGFRTRHPLRIVENTENLSFSVANNSALGQTDAELVLFLNNDVRPMEPHWLGWMVESVMADGTSACGARLVVPRRRIPRSEQTGMQGDLELQHAGIRFVSIDGMPRPRNIGGSDPAAPDLVAVQERPAATAACLLVRRDAFLAVGGFDSAYVYGYEDVDLCLRLRAAGGRIMVDGRAVLWHDESSTRRRDQSAATRARQRENRAEFYGRWGRSLFRDVLRDRLDRRGFLSSEPLSCAIAVAGEPPAEAVAVRDALARKGWAAEVLDAAAIESAPELVVATDPRVDVRELPGQVLKIAWIAGPAEPWIAAPWIDDFDMLLVGDKSALASVRRGTTHVPRPVQRAAVADGIEAELRRWLDARRAAIVVSDDVQVPIARSLQREFERRGIPATLTGTPSTRDHLVIQFHDRKQPSGPRALVVRDQSDAVSPPSEFVLAASPQATDADRVDEILRLVDELRPVTASAAAGS